MLFTSYKYFVFVVAAFCVYYLVARFSRKTRRIPGVRLQNVALVVLGYGFYAFWDWRWLFLLAGVSATGFVGGLLLRRFAGHRRLVLVSVLVADLLALGFFKYFGFFTDSLASLFGAHADWVTLHVVLPVGVSYYVFQNLSYVIDVYRGDVAPTTDVAQYAAALSFFPALLAGPITRPRDLLPQLGELRTFDDGRARDGLRQILWGLVKKMIVADLVGKQVDYVWGNVGTVDGAALLMVAVLYSVQIYCDFSGYADIAIGTGKLFNLRLSKNFDYPYFATSVRVFWRKWHITLASWMRDYVYIPLGGNRKGRSRQALNVLVTFFLVGLWHGAAFTFVIWGLLHGAYLAVENEARAWRKKRAAARAGAGDAPGVVALPTVRAWRAVLAAVGVFLLVTIAWVFFRAPSVTAAVQFFGHGFAHPAGPGDHLRYLASLLVSAGLLAYEWLTRRWEHGLAISPLPLPARWVAYVALCLAILLFGNLGGQEGIYVQF